MDEKLYVLEGSQCLQLEELTAPMDDHPLWICKYLVEGPQYISSMHDAYLSAGADILISVSYQTSIDAIQKCYDYSVDEAIETIQYSVKLARNAWNDYLKHEPAERKKPNMVAGSAGPYGALLHDGSEYTGTYVDSMSEEMLMDWHRPRVKALIDAGVDFIAFETLPSVVEGLAAVRLMREFPNSKAWVSFNCKDSKYTAHGEPFSEVIRSCCNRNSADQLVAIGINCTQPQFITDLLKSTNTTIPFTVYPNSGETFDSNLGWTGQRVDLGSLAREWIELGAKFVGGCCRTKPSDIVSIRSVVDSYSKAHFKII